MRNRRALFACIVAAFIFCFGSVKKRRKQKWWIRPWDNCLCRVVWDVATFLCKKKTGTPVFQKRHLTINWQKSLIYARKKNLTQNFNSLTDFLLSTWRKKFPSPPHLALTLTYPTLPLHTLPSHFLTPPFHILPSHFPNPPLHIIPSHCDPLYPSLHVHTYPSLASVQVPPLRHGFGWHLFSSVVCVTRHKITLHEVIQKPISKVKINKV